MTPDTSTAARAAGSPAPEAPGAWLLVTNDDGVESPALPAFLEAMAPLARVRAVVPARECSWSSKTLSRFARLRLEPVAGTHLPGEVYTLDGSPADCANVGIHNLVAAGRPGLVVSGLNIGANAGLAYLLSSGTVGAALEACLSGVPAAAFSLEMRPGDYARWRDRKDLEVLAPVWRRAAALAAQVTAEILRAGLPEGAQLVSVNLPPDADVDTPRVLTGVTDTRYGPFFRCAGDGWLEHFYSGLEPTGTDGSGDVEALDRGQVAITPLRLRLDVRPTERDRARFERP